MISIQTSVRGKVREEEDMMMMMMTMMMIMETNNRVFEFSFGVKW